MRVASLSTVVAAVTLVAAGCGSGGSRAALPTSTQEPASSQGSRVSSGTVLMEASSQGVAPQGFRTVIRVDPKPEVDGVIRDVSPLTVTFDACGSTADEGKTLHFLFDWDFDDVADMVGTGDACRQTHKYNVKAAPEGKGEALFETNVCVVNANPLAHAPGTYYSCRTYRIGLPRKGGCGTNEVSFQGKCYYLDGSTGACDPGFSLAPQSILFDIAPLFEGLTYKHQVSNNCCIYNSEPDEDWSLATLCNVPGPFPPGEPSFQTECADVMILEAGQLTLCGSNPQP